MAGVLAGLTLLILVGLDDSSAEAHYVEMADIRALHSGKCLDVAGSPGQGAGIQQYSCIWAADQQLEISEFADGWHQIKFRYNGLCLDVPGGTPDWGEQLWQWPCNGTDAQEVPFRDLQLLH